MHYMSYINNSQTLKKQLSSDLGLDFYVKLQPIQISVKSTDETQIQKFLR